MEIYITIAMATTIHVEEETRQILENLKAKESASSINDVILKLLESNKKTAPKTMFGVDKGKKIKVSRLEAHEI